MDKSHGQTGSPRGTRTRQRLLEAAAAMIAEVGWGRVTTRAVAARAGLPHGTVSYHFHGKQDLLTEAAAMVFEAAFPVEEMTAARDPVELVALVQAWLGEQAAADPLVARVCIEAMLEQERNPTLRERMTAMLAEYRAALAQVVREDQSRGTIDRAIDPDGLATLLIALGDGLFLHGRIDPGVDTAASLRALTSLLGLQSIRPGAQPASASTRTRPRSPAASS